MIGVLKILLNVIIQAKKLSINKNIKKESKMCTILKN
jgi:hypothetical protein